MGRALVNERIRVNSVNSAATIDFHKSSSREPLVLAMNQQTTDFNTNGALVESAQSQVSSVDATPFNSGI